MNYLQNYLDFYSGKNRKVLYKKLYDLITAMRIGDKEGIKPLLHEDCVANISMIGKGIAGKEKIASSLIFPVEDVNLRKISMSGVIIRSHDNLAIQAAQLQCMFGYEDEENVYPFVFGGCLLLEYKKEDGDWKIKDIKFDLAYEAGNNALVAGKWKLIDYNIFCGHEPMINFMYDSPWRRIPQDDEPQTTIEKIYEANLRANITTDTNDWPDYANVLASSFSMDMSARSNTNKTNASTADALMSNVRSNVDWIQGKAHKEPRLQHVISLVGIDVNKDETEADFYDYRSEFNRLYNEMYDKNNVHAVFYGARHHVHFVKENGEWKLSSGAFIPHQEFRYLPDNCIAYDEFICGGKTWQEITK
jgi:hypothetical protein